MADAAALTVCDKLAYVLRTVWIVKIIALIITVGYFSILFLLPHEPRVRRTQWGIGRGWTCIANIFVVRSEETDEWWCTSISEYAAARGSSGSKLLGGSLSVCGALQVIEGSLLSQLCIAPYSAAALLWAGGIGAIVLGQIESGDELDDTPLMSRMKKEYAVVHAVAALAFVLLSTAGVIIVADWVASGLALGGLLFFFLAVLAQNLTGNYVGQPAQCIIPQRPEDRQDPTARFARCHKWLNVSANRIILARIVLFSELAGTGLIIFAVTYLSIAQTQGRQFCTSTSCIRQI